MNGAPVAEKQLAHALEELLRERNRLLVLFCELAGVDEARERARRRLLQRFCQLLVDYLSLWQFEVHDLLARTEEKHQGARAELARQQPVILAAEEVALEFNDRYDDSGASPDLSRLDHHLSRLGEMLASRFDAEDRVIAAL